MARFQILVQIKVVKTSMRKKVRTMGDTLELFRPLCNGSVRVGSRTEKLIGDAAALLLRGPLGRFALIDYLAAQLKAPRGSRRITRSLRSLLRASVAIIAQVWVTRATPHGCTQKPASALKNPVGWMENGPAPKGCLSDRSAEAWASLNPQ